MPRPPPRCEQCREFFPRKHPMQKYCGEQCRNQAYIARRRQRIAKERQTDWSRKDGGVWRDCQYWPCGERFRAKARTLTIAQMRVGKPLGVNRGLA